MNNKFIVINDKAVIVDENANITVINYQDNIQKLLQKENQLKEIEDLNLEVREKIAKLSNQNTSLLDVFMPLIIDAGVITIVPFLYNLCTNWQGAEITQSIFGDIRSDLAFTISNAIMFTPLCFWLSYRTLKQKSNDINKLNALKAMEIYIDNKLKEELIRLDELKKDNSCSNLYTDSEEIVVERDDEFFDEFNKRSGLYYATGYKQLKYEKYAKKGILDKKLSKYYTDEEVKEVKGILKELNYNKKRNKTDI